MGSMPVELEYAALSSADSDTLKRLLTTAGAVGATACSLFLFDLRFNSLDPGFIGDQLPPFWSAAMIIQIVAGAALALACVAYALRPSTLTLGAAGITSIGLGVAWFAASSVDDSRWVSGLIRSPTAYGYFTARIVESQLANVAQVILPFVIAWACLRKPRDRAISQVLWVGLLLSCLPPISTAIGDALAEMTVVSASQLLQRRCVGIGVAVVLAVVALVRRPWPIIAALPLAAYVVAEICISGAKWQKALHGGPSVVTALTCLRYVSLAVLNASVPIAAFLIFSIGRSPHPKHARARDQV